MVRSNTYYPSPHLCVVVWNDLNDGKADNESDLYRKAPGLKFKFSIINTDTGVETEINEDTARNLCMGIRSRIHNRNWCDFCLATGEFLEDN